jgi:acylphosphatase
MKTAAANVTIEGYVQGVGFRWFAMQRAKSHNVAGWVRNNRDGSVSVYAEGDRGNVEAFLDDVRNGPASARVTNVDIDWQEYRGEHTGFTIKH